MPTFKSFNLKKGHKDFVTIVTAHTGGNIIILTVCSNLYEGYINAVREVFGKGIPIVLDRFHIAKLYRKGLDELRKREMKRLKKELPKEEYKIKVIKRRFYEILNVKHLFQRIHLDLEGYSLFA